MGKRKIFIEPPAVDPFHYHQCEACPTRWQCFRIQACPIENGAWPHFPAFGVCSLAMPNRVQRTRTKGGGMPEGAVYVGRPSVWGNPYTLADYGALALRLYRNTVQGIWNPAILDDRPDSFSEVAYQAHLNWRSQSRHILLPEIRALLRGKDLACWCPLNQPCHADILLEIANG